MEKSVLRKEILRALREFGGRDGESERIRKKIAASDEWKKARTILAFVPLPSEPDISPLLSDPRVLIPYMEDDERMEFGKGVGEKGALGVAEAEDKTPFQYSEALMLVPLVAADSCGRRLGRGKGCYDRYIRENRYRLGPVWGVALSPSMVERVPSDEGDETLDMIVTA